MYCMWVMQINVTRQSHFYIQGDGDFYLGPFNKFQFSNETQEAQMQAVWSGEQALTPIYRIDIKGEEVKITEGFSLNK